MTHLNGKMAEVKEQIMETMEFNRKCTFLEVRFRVNVFGEKSRQTYVLLSTCLRKSRAFQNLARMSCDKVLGAHQLGRNADIHSST